MRRHAIGAIALLLFAGAMAFVIWEPRAVGWQVQFQAACWRVGAGMAVLWIAYPDLQRMPPWVWAVLLAAMVVIAAKPRAAMLIVPLIIILAVLRPRFGQRK